MGKLSSFFGGGCRAGRLALIIALAAALIADAAFAAKYRGRDRVDRRGDDSPWSSRDTNARGNSDSGSRGSSDAGSRSNANTSARNSGSKRDTTDKDDKGSDKNDRTAKSNKDDDDDDDGRGGPQRDSSKAQTKPAGAGKGNADDADPPRTVVEMLQRMFPSPANSPDGKRQIAPRTLATSAKPQASPPRTRKPPRPAPPGRRHRAALLRQRPRKSNGRRNGRVPRRWDGSVTPAPRTCSGAMKSWWSTPPAR